MLKDFINVSGKNEFLRLVVLFALTTYVTYVFQIPVIQEAGQIPGYLNLGDIIVIFTALRFGAITGLVVGGLASGLADVLSSQGSFFWATLLIKGLEGFFCGLLRRRPFLASFTGGLIMVVGYFFFEKILYGSWGNSKMELPFNLAQAIVGIIVGYSTFQLWQYLVDHSDEHEAGLLKNSSQIVAAMAAIIGTLFSLVLQFWKMPVDIFKGYVGKLNIRLYEGDDNLLYVHYSGLLVILFFSICYLLVMITLFLIQLRLSYLLASHFTGVTSSVIRLLIYPASFIYILLSSFVFIGVKNCLIEKTTLALHNCIAIKYIF